MTKIRQATSDDINSIINLYHEYRAFYRQPKSDDALTFLNERLKKKESIIIIAEVDNRPAGFCQIFHSFSSIQLGPISILNDLYVAPEFRRKKIAETLVKEAIKIAQNNGSKSINLSTQIANTNAQELYKKIGFKKDNDFFHFFFKF